MALDPKKAKDNDYKFPMKARCDGILDEVPNWQRDNEYILSGYRVHHDGFWQIAKSSI